MKTLSALHFNRGKLLALAFFSLAYISSYAQNTGKEEYLIAKIKGTENNYRLYIDYSNYIVKENYPLGEPVNDSLGKTMKFGSESAALNYIAKQSWTMFAVVPSIAQSSVGETRYIFRRQIMNEPVQQIKTTAE